MTPQVSVVLPTYNGASRGYLTQAIESVLNQSYRNYELLIVDDGSTDTTKDECNPYLRIPKVRYIFQRNGGPASARNAGIKASIGEYVCFLDDDDRWKPDKLKRQIEFIHSRLLNVQDWGMIFTWIELIDDCGNVLGYRGHHQEGSLYRLLFFENTIDATSSVLVKRIVFNKVGLFDESLRTCQDWDIWLRIAKEYLIFPVREYLVQYREHNLRRSGDHGEMTYYEELVLKKALTNAPDDISTTRVYASWYLKRSKALFASEDYVKFREWFFKGARLSIRAVKLQHWALLLLSFSGGKLIRSLKKMKLYSLKRIADYKYRRRALAK